MTLIAVEPDNIKIGRGTGRSENGSKYSKYKFAIQKVVLPSIKEELERLESGIDDKREVAFRINEIKNEMGKEFIDIQNRSLYLGLKYALFKEGIRVAPGKHTDGSDVLMMRKTTPDDTLPDFLEDSK